MTAINHAEHIDVVDWASVAKTVLLSRAIDYLEESVLAPQKKVLYQFSARGHELAQVLLGCHLTNEHDGVSAYYRSRPLLLKLGLSAEDALASPMAKSGGFSDGRDIGVVCNMPSTGGPTVLPMAGDVGSQYTPGVGWAQAQTYLQKVLGEDIRTGAISTILGGDASVATNGFWSSLTIATTLRLPVLFFIEDNGYGISVTSDLQTPGGDIARNLASFENLHILSGSGTDPEETSGLISEAVAYVRQWNGPALLRVTVPRLCGHSGQDTQAYKSASVRDNEEKDDPLPKLRSFYEQLSLDDDWGSIESSVKHEIEIALTKAEQRPPPDSLSVRSNIFFSGKHADVGGQPIPKPTKVPPDNPGKNRINMVAAIRQTLESELNHNRRAVVFGEDVGLKGGVHAATLDLQSKFGDDRVFDTSLSEEGIIGRSVGMAMAGLMPVAEIQFRKYADPAMEQLHNCGTIRWRTNNRFCAPIVVRMPGGFAKVGDPWHSVSNEVMFAHAIGWQVAVPSNASDAVGLLRTAMRGYNPTIFFEHRALLDSPSARRPYPGDNYTVRFGEAQKVRSGSRLTIVSWGAMVERCSSALDELNLEGDLIDLRTIVPWDFDSTADSIKKTGRCLIVHEDNLTAGFGAEISATIGEKLFSHLDAPVVRLAVPDVPIPHNVELMNSVVPTVSSIMLHIQQVVNY